MSTDQRASGRVLHRSAAATALLPRFLEHRRRDVTTIQAALTTGDFEAIRRIGHNMAGNGLSYGFPEISAMGERLEAAAGARDVGAASDELAALEEFLARTAVRRDG